MAILFFVLTGLPEILKILLRDENLSPEVDLSILARDTPTFSGSDLKRKSRFGSRPA
jgi:ATP-dependent Zn protease